MFTTAGLLKLHGWAHYSFNLLIDHAGKIPWELATRQFTGFGFPSLLGQLAHISGAEAFWNTALRSQVWEGWPYHTAENIAEVRLGFERAAAMTQELLGRLSDEELAVPRQIQFPSGGTGQFSVALVIHHVITHGFHHKGQAVAICRLLGYPAPETDLDANGGHE